MAVRRSARPSLTAEDNQSSHDIIAIILSDHLGAVELLHETQAR